MRRVRERTRRVRLGRLYSQATKHEDTCQSYLLRTSPVEPPDVGHWEGKERNIRQDVWNGYAHKEGVVVHDACCGYLSVPKSRDWPALEDGDQDLVVRQPKESKLRIRRHDSQQRLPNLLR